MSSKPPLAPTHADLNEAERRISRCAISHGMELDLSELKISSLPEGLRAIKWLKKLDITSCGLTELPTWIGELVNLSTINMGGCDIIDFPLSFNNSGSIVSIFLSEASSWHLPSSATRKLHSVIYMYIEASRGRIPAWIRENKKIEILNIFGAEGNLPTWIVELYRLRRLTVAHGDLRSLPASLGQLQSLKYLDLTNNPNLGIPDEVIAGRDATKIINYYFRINDQRALPLNEFKLVMVGRGGVGKTSLVHKLVTGDYEEFPQTPGVQIREWRFELNDETVNARVWDFGGQEILHGTHRFFMTERAVYLVLLSGRDGHGEQDAHYWLSLVRSFAGDVPVIILLHRWSECRFEVSIRELRRTYGHGIHFLETDSVTNHNIQALRDAIKSLAQLLPGLKSLWPSAWRRVKEELPIAKKSWLSFSDFCAFAQARGVSVLDDQQALADCLHDLGLMLSYRTDPVLRDCGVLNPQWATHAIYKVLNDKVVCEAGGEMSLATFAQVLSGEESQLYPANLHVYLLALMRKFLLCLPLDERGKRYLIPDLLSIAEPPLGNDFPEEGGLAFQYSYKSALPEGLLPRFIVETYVHREPQNTWRRGVVLQRAGCRALVRGDMQARTVTVRVVGTSRNGRRELLAIIREHFERIHRSYEQLVVTEFVPVIGAVRPIPYALLRKLERTEKPVVQVEYADDVREVAVRLLLDGVELPDVPRPALSGDRRSGVYIGVSDSAPLLFISYADADSIFFDQLRLHLILQERQGRLRIYGRALMLPGQDIDEERSARLREARIVVPLLSSDYFNQVDCVDRELQPAMKRRELNECVVVPVLIRACQVSGSAVGSLKSLPSDGRAITDHSNRDSAWFTVIEDLVRLLG